MPCGLSALVNQWCRSGTSMRCVSMPCGLSELVNGAIRRSSTCYRRFYALRAFGAREHKTLHDIVSALLGFYALRAFGGCRITLDFVLSSRLAALTCSRLRLRSPPVGDARKAQPPWPAASGTAKRRAERC